MKGLNETEAFVLEVASGALVPIFWPSEIMTPYVNKLVERRLLVHNEQPEANSTETMLHYQVQVTSNGRMMLQLYRDGIR